MFQTCPERETPGHQSIPCRGASGTRRMSIRESSSQCRQPFHSGSMNLFTVTVPGVILIGAGVSHAHIVSHKENNIGVRIFSGGKHRNDENNRKKKRTHPIDVTGYAFRFNRVYSPFEPRQPLRKTTQIQNGQKIGISAVAAIHSRIFRGIPILRKSVNL